MIDLVIARGDGNLKASLKMYHEMLRLRGWDDYKHHNRMLKNTYYALYVPTFTTNLQCTQQFLHLPQKIVVRTR